MCVIGFKKGFKKGFSAIALKKHEQKQNLKGEVIHKRGCYHAQAWVLSRTSVGAITQSVGAITQSVGAITHKRGCYHAHIRSCDLRSYKFQRIGICDAPPRDHSVLM